LELTRVGNHGPIELKDLYHGRARKHIWKDNKVKLKVQIEVDEVPISIIFIQSLL
jgi:hypothetical protein